MHEGLSAPRKIEDADFAAIDDQHVGGHAVHAILPRQRRILVDVHHPHGIAVGDQATDQRGILGGLEGWPVGLPGHPRRVITQPAIKPGCVMDLGLDLVGINRRIPVSGGSVRPC